MNDTDINSNEQYIIDIEYIGKFNCIGRNVFHALETLKNELSPKKPEDKGAALRWRILSAYVIKDNEMAIDITDFLNS